MRLKPKNRAALVEAASGRRVCDLVIRNVRLVNVFTKEIYSAEVGIYDGFIAHVEADPEHPDAKINSIEGHEIYDGKGQYLIPGFIDTHVHIESTMMTPPHFAAMVVPLGTTTVVTDPHEVANVAGIDGVNYMIESGKGLPMRHYVLAPSCVPAMPAFEEAGASFGRSEIETLLTHDEVLGVAEVMDFPGVISNNSRMRDVIEAADKKDGFIQGHAMGIKGRALSAYICGGPVSNHELGEPVEFREALRNGMYIDAKLSTYVDRVTAAIKSLEAFDSMPETVSLCTDDRETDGIAEQGHMNAAVNAAIRAGMRPIDAISCATIHAAREIGIEKLGAVAPGFAADLCLVPSLSEIKPSCVFFNGQKVAEDGKLLIQLQERTSVSKSLMTVMLPELTEEMFRIKVPTVQTKITTNVICQDPKTGLTDFKEEALPVRNGYLDLGGDSDLKYVAVINRHGGSGFTVGVIRGFPIKKGCIASTVAHDSHNLVIVYNHPEEALTAAQSLKECGGGLICVEGTQVLGRLELPIYGLLSALKGEELASKHRALNKAAQRLTGESAFFKNPLMNITVLALPVAPWARITDRGLFSLRDMAFKQLFPN